MCCPQPWKTCWDHSHAVRDQGKDGVLEANPAVSFSHWQRSGVDTSKSRVRGGREFYLLQGIQAEVKDTLPGGEGKQR